MIVYLAVSIVLLCSVSFVGGESKWNVFGIRYPSIEYYISALEIQFDYNDFYLE